MRRLVIASGLLLICIGAGWLAWHRPACEPIYQGRTLSEWLDAAAYQDASWWPGQKATDEAICAMGTNALPFLLKRQYHVGDKASPLKARITSWLWRLNLKKQARSYHDPWGQERWTATLNAIHALQPRAKEVVPALEAIYRGPGDQKLAALDALGWLQAKEAVPFLLGEAASTNAEVRHKVFWALGMIHPEPEVVLPVLIRGLEDPDLSVRQWAAKGLGDYGPAAKQAVPALTRFLEEENQTLKSAPTSMGHRQAQGAAEFALRSIEAKASAPPTNSQAFIRPPGFAIPGD